MQERETGIAGNPLTQREMDVLLALSRGLTRDEIACEQYVTVSAVKAFMGSIYGKLGAHSRAEAMAAAVSRGYIGSLAPG